MHHWNKTYYFKDLSLRSLFSLKRAGLLVIAFLFFTHCNEENFPGLLQSSDTIPWKNVLKSGSGEKVYLLRKEGVNSIIAYLPDGSDGTSELHPTIKPLTEMGFGLLTIQTRDPMKSIPSSEAKIRSSQPEDAFLLRTTSSERYQLYRKQNDLLQLIQKGISNNPGLKNTVLIIPGRATLPTLIRVTRGELDISGLVVLQPDLKKEKDLIRSIATRGNLDIPVLWINSSESRLPAMGHGATGGVSDHISIHLLLEKENISISDVIQNDIFTNFILIQKHNFRWKEVKEAFPQGCSYRKDGGGKINTSDLMVSGLPENHFCPLFLLSLSGKIYRATGAEKHSCKYRLSLSEDHIYCHFPPDQLTEKQRSNPGRLHGLEGSDSPIQPPPPPELEEEFLPPPHQKRPG